MKNLLKLILILSICCCWRQVEADQPVFDNSVGGPGSTSIITSDQNVIVSDDFILSITTRLSRVEWFGQYVFDNVNHLPPPEPDFTIQVYEDIGESPGGLIAEFYVGNDVNREATGILNIHGEDTYSFSAAIDFIAQANTRYWITIFENTISDTVSYSMERSNQGGNSHVSATSGSSWFGGPPLGGHQIDFRLFSHNLLLNGDFEFNFATQDILDAENSLFNFLMNDVHSFGSLDSNYLLTHGSQHGEDPQCGNWKIIVIAEAIGDRQELSLSLAEPLVAGQLYFLEFQLERVFLPPTSGGRVEFGASHYQSQFGSPVYLSPESTFGWTRHRTTFVSTDSTEFLTLRVDGSGDHAVGVDNVKLHRVVLGDTNLDGQVDLLDVAPFVAAATSINFQPEADMDRNGTVNLLDVVPFVELLAEIP